MSAGRFPDTPSSGQQEVRQALLAGKANGGRRIPVRQIARHIAPRIAEDQTGIVQGILNTLQTAGDVDTDGADKWGLTAQGLQAARTRPSPRYQL